MITRGSETYSLTIQRLTAELRPNLMLPAQVIWHHNNPPWMPVSLLGSSCAFDDAEFRKAFLRTHENKCLMPREQPNENHNHKNSLHPNGYTGNWVVLSIIVFRITHSHPLGGLVL